MKVELLSHLACAFPWRDRLHCLDCVDSTNTYAKALAFNGAPHGTAVIASRQTGGRGRMGRSFYSPQGSGLYLSVILRPACKPVELMHLTCGAAVAVCDALENLTGHRPQVKWINDLVWENKKLGGILTELGFDSSGNVDYAVVGIGINCMTPAGGYPADIQNIATALDAICDFPISPAAAAAAILCQLENTADRLIAEKASIMERYRLDCLTIGKQVCTSDGVTGIATQIDDSGALLLSIADGTEQWVQSGEVSVRGMYGYI